MGDGKMIGFWDLWGKGREGGWGGWMVPVLGYSQNCSFAKSCHLNF